MQALVWRLLLTPWWLPWQQEVGRVPSPWPQVRGSLLDAVKARELNSSAAVSQDSPSLSWEGRPGRHPAPHDHCTSCHGTQLYRRRNCLGDCFWCKPKSFLSLKLQWEERNVPLMSASSRTEEEFFQTQFYSMQAGNLTTIWNFVSRRNYVVSFIKLAC